MELLYLVLHTGQGKLHCGAFYFKCLLQVRFITQRIDMLSGGERKVQELPGTVDQLARRDICRTADFRAADILSLRFDQQQFCGAPTVI